MPDSPVYLISGCPDPTYFHNGAAVDLSDLVAFPAAL